MKYNIFANETIKYTIYIVKYIKYIEKIIMLRFSNFRERRGRERERERERRREGEIVYSI